MTRAATLLTAACLAALALPHPAAAQDLATAIADARAHSPALEAAAADADAAAARLAQARAAAGPTASVEGSIGTGRLDPGGYFGLTAQSVTPSAVQLVGEYPLYAGGRISAAIDQAAAGSRAATLGKDMARQNLTLATVGAYAEVLTARDLVASYGKLVDALGEIVRHTGLRYDVGDATSSEVAQAKARRAEGQAGLVQAQGRLTAALARLERLTGKPVGDLAPLPPRPEVPATLGEAVEAAVAANVLLAQADAGVDGAAAGVRAAKATNRPQLGVFAEGARIRDQFFPDYRADSVTVGLRGRWTFFDSGAGSARVREAQSKLSASEARLRQARDDVTAPASKCARAPARRSPSSMPNAKRSPRPHGSPKRRHRCRPRRGASACSAVSNRPPPPLDKRRHLTILVLSNILSEGMIAWTTFTAIPPPR